MTKDEWTALGEKLSYAYGSAKIVADGFEVSFQTQQDKMRLVIAVYVNGWMKGEWLVNKTEEAIKFCRPVTFRLHRPSDVKKITAGIRKSTIKKLMPDLEKKGMYYTTHWLSFSALKRHLIANNQSITLVKPSASTQEGGV
jgi:hypothetical protein